MEFKREDGNQWREPFERWAHRSNAASFNVSANDSRIKFFAVDGALNFGLTLTPDEAASLAAELLAASTFVVNAQRAAEQVLPLQTRADGSIGVLAQQVAA